MSAFGSSAEDDDRVGDEDSDAVPTIEIDAPDDHEELQADLDLLAAEVADEAIDLDEVDLRSADATEGDPMASLLEDEAFAAGQPAPTGARRAELDAMVAQVAASQVPDDDWPERDETGPGTLRPKVPEPVIATRTTSSPSMARRTASRMRALVGLVFVVILAGVGLAGAIGAAVLLVVLALSRAFGS